MSTILTVKLNYQHCEEVLATNGLYEVDGGLISIQQGQIVCQEAAEALYALRANITGIMGANDRLVSIETFIPSDENEGWGPFGFHYAVNAVGTDAARVNKLTDMIAAQIVWSGVNELDEPVRNAKFWSCLTPADVDCMELQSAAITEISSAFESFFPETLTLSSAELIRVVRNQRAGVGGLITYHPCTEVVASPTLASVGTRRGDITPRKGKLVPTP